MLAYKANCYTCVMTKCGEAAVSRRPTRSDLMALLATEKFDARVICQSDCHSGCSNT